MSLSRCQTRRRRRISHKVNAIAEGISSQKRMAIEETPDVHNTKISKEGPIE